MTNLDKNDNEDQLDKEISDAGSEESGLRLVDKPQLYHYNNLS